MRSWSCYRNWPRKYSLLKNDGTRPTCIMNEETVIIQYEMVTQAETWTIATACLGLRLIHTSMCQGVGGRVV